MNNYPIKNLTNLEQKVFSFITKQCLEGSYCVWVVDIVEGTGLSVNTVKGVLGSLTKKDLIYSESREVDFTNKNDIFPVFGGLLLSFGDEDGELSTSDKALAQEVAAYKFN